MKDYPKLDRMFLEFKGVWPREARFNDLLVRKALGALDPGGETFREMIEAVRWQAGSVYWERPERIPEAHWWIKDRKWQEERGRYPQRKNGQSISKGDRKPSGEAGGFSDDARRSEEARRKLGL